MTLGQAASGIGRDQQAGIAELGLLSAFAQPLELEAKVVVDPREAPRAGPSQNRGQLQLRPPQHRPTKLQAEGRQERVRVLVPRRRPDDLERAVERAQPLAHALVDVDRQVAGQLEVATPMRRLYAEAADDPVDVEEQQGP